jgi:dinuclear metal center YbgI/SA1388 family protein
MKRSDLVALLDQLLVPGEVRDYGPNGLQFEGRDEVRRVALGVTACQALLDKAAGWDADAVLVHHGLFWGSSAGTRIVRSLRARLARLFEADMSLLAYHLPLDRHLEVGNNAVLARRLGAELVEAAFEMDGATIGVVARLPEPVALDEMTRRIARETGRDPLVAAGGPGRVESFGVVTGRAPDLVGQAALAGLDLFLTGEPSEPAVHLAREEGIHFVAAGHHATERFGVQALGAWLEEEAGLETRFFEIPNPV